MEIRGRHRSRAGESDSGSDFDIALWGYDRKQVDRCLDELTGKLEEALGQLQLVDDLQTQLYQAQLEIERLRQRPLEPPAWSEHLATIMATAEQLRDQAAGGAVGERSGSRTGRRADARVGERAGSH